ncbi:MAG: NDP-sugar synthase [Acidobacteriota bacterium]
MFESASPQLTSGIVLAGTFPWANSLFEQLAPRPLVPVAHRPLIEFALSWLQTGGVRQVVICGNRNSRALEAQIARGPSAALELSYLEDSMPRGAAGCARDAAMSCHADRFVVTDAAAIPTLDLRELLAVHDRSGAALTLAVYDEARSGGRSPLHAPAGIYVIDRRILESVALRGFVDIKEHLIPRLVRAGERIATYAVDGAVARVLNAHTYLAVHDIVTARTTSAIDLRPGYDPQGQALVHRDAIVEPGVTFVGPVLVAAGARIEAGAVLIGPTSIGCDATVGAGALVSRSAVWRRSRIGAGAFLDRSILGDDSIVAAGRQFNRAVVAGEARRAMVSVPASHSPRSAA